jgi:ABC-type transporter Mla subunit MlaD
MFSADRCKSVRAGDHLTTINLQMATDFERDLDQGFSRRIDQLLSSALEEQSKEQQLMIDTVQAARSSLTAAQEDIAALRRLVEGGDAEIAGLLERRLDSVEEKMTTTRDRVEESLGEMNRVVEQFSGWLGDVVGSLNEAVAASSRHTGAEVGRLIERLNETEASLAEAIGASSESTAGDAKRLLDRLGQETTQHLRRLLERLGGTEENLAEAITATNHQLDADLGRLAERMGEGEKLIAEVVETGTARNFDRIQKAREEIGALRGHLETFQASLDSVGDVVDERMAEHREEEQKARAAISRQVKKLTEAIGELPSAFDEGLRAEREATAEARAALTRQVDRIGEAASEVAEGLSEVVREPLVEIADAVAPLTGQAEKTDHRIRQVNRRLTEANSRIEALHEGLVAYLAQRDDRLEGLREELFADLIRELSGGMSRRDRKRLSGALEDAEQRRRDRADAERYRRLVAERRAEKVAADLEKARHEMEDAATDAPKGAAGGKRKPSRKSPKGKAKGSKRKQA